ncbi:MAG: rod shape-determining protein MreD [Oscillospiraceae bacterium]|nr:rod shape-determining protein MreD [Oscillospiraceae bacterium]
MFSNKLQKSNRLLLQVIQWILFAVVIFICYLLETSGSAIKPLLLIPVSLCIASHTGELQAMAVGAVCGLLLDLACGKLLGFNAFFLVICGVLISLLYRYFLRQKLFNMIFLTAVCTLMQGYIDYLLYYAVWGYEDVSLIWQKVIFPSCLMTIASAVLFYFLIKKIAEKCGNHRINQLEKTILSDLQE